MFTHHLQTGEKVCRIIVQPGLLRDDPLFQELLPGASSYLIVTDQNVAQCCGESLLNRLQSYGRAPCGMLQLQPGEQGKQLAAVATVYEFLNEQEADRDALLLALGGGVVGDITGFAAATWMRGVRYLQLPSSLLAMVDSGVGGKTGVNLQGSKNLIGAFHQPEVVLVDPELLETLPHRHFLNGIPEMIKYGAVLDRRLFSQLENNLEKLIQERQHPDLQEIIARCLTLKAEIVSQDVRDSGLRMLLNFGHTVGHALEKCSQGDLLHGEAVAGGMIAASLLSTRIGLLDQPQQDRLIALIRELPLPPLPSCGVSQLVSAMRHDKKRTRSGQQWVLLSDIGRGLLQSNVAAEEIESVLEQLLG